MTPLFDKHLPRHLLAIEYSYMLHSILMTSPAKNLRNIYENTCESKSSNQNMKHFFNPKNNYPMSISCLTIVFTRCSGKIWDREADMLPKHRWLD